MVSATPVGNSLARPAAPVDGTRSLILHDLVASRLAAANAHCVCGRLFCFRFSRCAARHSEIIPKLHRADTCAQLAGVARTAPSISPLLPASVGKPNFGRTRLFAASAFAAALLCTDFAGCSRSFRSRQSIRDRQSFSGRPPEKIGRWHCHPRRFAPRAARTAHKSSAVLADRARKTPRIKITARGVAYRRRPKQ